MSRTTADLSNQSTGLIDYDLFSSHSALVLAKLGEADDGELHARDLTQRITLAAQAALLRAHGPAASCEAFLASRLAAGAPAAFGTLPRGSDCDALTARVREP